MAATTVEANKELVHEYLEVLNDHQVDRLPEFYADDFSVDLMQLDDGGSEEGGVDEIIEGTEELFEAFPDVSLELQEIAAEGDWVIYRFEAEGTHEGEFKGIEPTGNEVSWQVHESKRIEDGEFVEVHGTVSIGWLLAQLGVDLPMETGD